MGRNGWAKSTLMMLDKTNTEQFLPQRRQGAKQESFSSFRPLAPSREIFLHLFLDSEPQNRRLDTDELHNESTEE